MRPISNSNEVTSIESRTHNEGNYQQNIGVAPGQQNVGVAQNQQRYPKRQRSQPNRYCWR